MLIKVFGFFVGVYPFDFSVGEKTVNSFKFLSVMYLFFEISSYFYDNFVRFCRIFFSFVTLVGHMPRIQFAPPPCRDFVTPLFPPSEVSQKTSSADEGGAEVTVEGDVARYVRPGTAGDEKVN